MSALIPQRRKSIKELHRVQALSVATGILGTVIDISNLSYPFITVTVRANTSSPFDIVVQFNPNGAGPPSLSSTAPPITITDGIVSDGLRAQTSWIEARTDHVLVYLRNTDTVDHTYDVLVHGIA